MGVMGYRSRSTVYFVDLGIYPTIDLMYKASRAYFSPQSVKTFQTFFSRGQGRTSFLSLVPMCKLFPLFIKCIILEINK